MTGKSFDNKQNRERSLSSWYYPCHRKRRRGLSIDIPIIVNSILTIILLYDLIVPQWKSGPPQPPDIEILVSPFLWMLSLLFTISLIAFVWNGWRHRRGKAAWTLILLFIYLFLFVNAWVDSHDAYQYWQQTSQPYSLTGD
jgi:phosphoglycerol transferase MdoB-like AlkP superfamily enzyme